MKMVKIFEKIHLSQDEPLFKDVIWLYKKVKTKLDPTDYADNLFECNIWYNGDWRDILKLMWDNKTSISLIETQLKTFATKDWVKDLNFVDSTVLADYITRTEYNLRQEIIDNSIAWENE